MRIFTLMMNMIFIQAPKTMRKFLQAQFGFANHLALVCVFQIYKKWAQRENRPINISVPNAIGLHGV